MIQDQQLKMSDAQTGITASGASTSVIDATKKGDALDGNQMYWFCRVGATALDSTNHTGTVVASLETADDSSFSVNKTVLCQTGAPVVTALTAGVVLAKMLVGPGLRQFTRTYYTIGTENLTAGTLDSMLVADVDVLIPNF